MSMKKYYALLNNGKFFYLGEFLKYSDAYDYADYDLNLNLIWIFKESKLEELHTRVETILLENKLR